MRLLMKKSLVRNAILLASAGAFAGAQVGCSSPGATSSGQAPTTIAAPGTPSANATGTVGMTLTLPGGELINTVSWTVTGPSGASTVVQSGSVNLQNSLSVSFVITGLPAASGYSIALSGTSVDATVTCAGSVSFSVAARATTSVSDLLQCNPTAAQTGSLSVSGVPYDCAAWSGVSVIPSEATVGHSLAVSATATGANPAALTYAWSAPSGSFDTPNAGSANFTCATPGAVTLTLTVGDGPVPDGGSCSASLSTTTVQVTCDAALDAGGGAGSDAGSSSDGGSGSDASDGGTVTQALVTTVGAGVFPAQVVINQGTAIGEGSLNGATPFLLNNLAVDPNNTQTIASSDGGAPFLGTGNVPDTAFGFCTYPTDGGAPTRISHITGAKFETSPEAGTSDPMVPLTPAYFPLVYSSTNTTTGNAFGGHPPIIGLFDWRPKDIDEGLLAAESDDFGKTWYFMQLVLELDPDYTSPISGGYSPTATATGCPTTVNATNVNYVSANGSQDDDGWGHAAIIQLPGVGNVKTGQMLYMLDRNTNNIPGTSIEIVDGNPLWVISLGAATGSSGGGSTAKFPIWNTNFVEANNSNNDIKSISSTLTQTPDSGAPITVQQTVGLTDPDGIMAVFPTSPTAAAGSPVTVLWVQKILNGDNTGSTALPIAQQCTKAPFSGKTNHDIATVHLATTTDGVHFTDLGAVSGLSDPTTVDYNKTRWVSPRGTLIDINGNGSLWGLYFSAGNCLDGDSDAFHYIGYAESPDMMHWTVFNDINSPIASINPITATNQATGLPVTIPSNSPLVPTQAWFAERLYAPTATQIDSTHLSLTFAGYGVQTPSNDLLDYRAIGNVVLTVSQPLPAGVPNNINTH
jgi:hypothetical protein